MTFNIGEKVYSPLYIWGNSQFPFLFLKPTNLLLYIWEISKYLKSITFQLNPIKLPNVI